jgi:CHAD domain-containing protein
MNKDLLIKHIRWLFKEYNNQFRLALRGGREEPVHDLRVMIKRLNALFLFLDEAMIYRKKSTTFFNQLHVFFKSAGNLRDIQVMKSLIGSYRDQVKGDITGYENYITRKEITAKESFFERAKEYPGEKQIQVKQEIVESIRKFGDEDLTDKSFAFMIKRLNHIDRYLKSFDSRKYLHKIRQTLKQLRFFIEILHAGSQFPLIDDYDYNEIKEIENVIGGWNDRSLMIEDIKRFISYSQKLGSRSSYQSLTELQEIVSKERKEMVKDIEPRLLKFIYHLKYSIL